MDRRLNLAIFCFRLIWTVIFLALWPVTLRAEGPVQGVFKLIGTESCATGFAISGDRILTNAHVTQRNCSQTSCPGLQIIENGQAISFKEAILEEEINAFDIAVVRITGAKPFTALELSPRPPEVGQAVSVTGFPNCGKLTKTVGQVSVLNSFQFFSTAPIKHGNSGGPVQSADGQVLGIVSQISDPLTGLISSIARTSGDSKLVRGDLAREIIGQAPPEKLRLTANYALEFIKNDLSNLGGLRRLLGGIDLTSILQGTLIDASKHGSPPSSLAWTLMEQSDLRNFPVQADPAPVQELAALSFLELKGTAFAESEENLDRLVSALPGSDPETLRTNARRLSNSYLGLIPTTLIYLGGVILLILFWTGASCGFVMYGQTSGWTRLRRAGLAVATPLVLLSIILLL